MLVLPFAQPDLEPRYFDVEKARAWEVRFGVEFPYRPDEHIYALLGTWVLMWEERDGFGKTARWRLCIPRGYVTDLSSVPWFLRWVVDRSSMGWAAPLAHDVLYRWHGGPLPADWCQKWVRGHWRDSERVFTRSWADRLFRDTQRSDKRRPFVRWASWLGVRANVFAALRWNKP